MILQIKMNIFQMLIFIFIYLISNVNANCIWYGGIRDSYNEIYLHGPPKPLPLVDVQLLNEMCPHIATPKGDFVFFRSLNSNGFVLFYCRCFAEFML